MTFGWMRRTMRAAGLAVCALLACISCGGDPQQPGRAVHPAPSQTPPATYAANAAAADDGQWLIPARDYASTRYSGLNEINAGNVSRLRVAWTFSTGVNAGHEAAPLVVGSTMYLVAPFPNTVFALDLSQPGAPIKWKYDPKPEAAARGVACCDVVNRGASYANGTIFFNTLDGRAIALSAETGEPRWETKLADINKGETITMAPLIVGDKVLVGNSGGEFGVRGWLAALDAGSGAIVWKAFSTGPDRDVLIGPEFKPFYPMDRGVDLGVASWPPQAWNTGGGTVWGWISYDRELDLIYYGTGNPGPWNPEQRPGDNKWTSGIFARSSDGKARWFYQWSPHDLYDHDGVNENLLLDLHIGGRMRKTLVRPERNGYIYVMDRQTGEILSYTPFVHITSSKGVDLRSGKLIPVKEKEPRTGIVVRDICPSAPGAKDWQPSSYSPRTGLIYLPHNNLCMDFEGVEASYIAGTPYVGANVVYKPGPGGHRGEVTAWDPVNARPVWKIREPYMPWSGTLATGGDIVFYGTMEGWFKAVDARTGALLWQFKTESGIVGQPISFRGPDGHQYIAVFSGIGGWPGAVITNDLDTRDATAALGWGATMADLKAKVNKGGTLYVFTVEGR